MAISDDFGFLLGVVHVLSAGLVGLALKLHVALGGIAHRPLESLYSAQTFRVGPKLTNSASRLGFWADAGPWVPRGAAFVLSRHPSP
jgi:hypothetical protein